MAEEIKTVRCNGGPDGCFCAVLFCLMIALLAQSCTITENTGKIAKQVDALIEQKQSKEK
jgi:hypothetical protein